MNESMRELYSDAQAISSAGQKTYEEVLDDIQKYFMKHHADLFNAENMDDVEYERLQKSQIEKYLADNHIKLSVDNIVDKVYNDMARFGVLNDLIYVPGTKEPHEGLEEVNVNSWEDIEVIYNGQAPTKTGVHFNNAQEAKNMFDRILSLNGQKIDIMTPTLVTYLPKGIRVCVNQPPVVMKADGIAASIRIVKPNLLSADKIVKDNIASDEMLKLISMLHSYGVSIAISGGTSTGKTTFLSALLREVEHGKRIVIIEEATREINIIERDENGNIVNSVVSLTTRPHHDPAYSVTASKLIERALTMNPDYIIIAEMKGEESIMAAEAAITGQVCMTTIHANEAGLAYDRMVDLALKKYQMNKEHLMAKMVQAFPIVVQLEHSPVDHQRRVIEIVEAVGTQNGQPIIQPLFQYDYETGQHKRIHPISEHLQTVLLKKGLPKSALNPFLN